MWTKTLSGLFLSLFTLIWVGPVSAEVTSKTSPPSGKVAYTAPKGWVQEKPSSRMRTDQFRLPGVKGSEDGELSVFFFSGTGGSVDANLMRWYSQFRKADGSKITKPEKKEEQKIQDLPVTTVFLRGTYFKTRAPMMTGGPKEEKKGYALWGAIAETQEGPWFFKAIGPERTIENWRASLDTFAKSLHLAKR